MTGPRMDAMTEVAPMKPVYRLLFLRGMLRAMMTKSPPTTPAVPMPAMALPMMSVVDV